ncbi:uncharacterized protein LOC126997698 isoform X2 [Eriocheir sinensis]|uniref:uncharacterized protein LOC126997698 isoform X2 n=1 Tax=Eriocheir sinensis TaxID=95602 RepID=UPI0021C6B2EA|nr:uncharacterized protein LOC126997698 isoform X2 [Eriocheir sinensis]
MESSETKKLVRFCVAPGCCNKGSQKHISFYHFPPVSSKRSARGSRRGRWFEAVMGALPPGETLPSEYWKYPTNARLCSNHFISGKKSEDPLSPDYIPSVFANQTAEERRAGKAALKAYNRQHEAKGTVWPIQPKRKPGKTEATPKSSVPKRVRIEVASSPVTLEDSDTQSVASGMLDYEEVARAKKEALRERDQQKEEEEEEEPQIIHIPDQYQNREEEEEEETQHNPTTINPLTIDPVDDSSNTPSNATSQNLEDPLVDDERHYRSSGNSSSSDDSDDDDDDSKGVKYEDPRTLLLTGKYKELMKALQVYRKNLAASTASEKNPERLAIGKQRPNYEATTAPPMQSAGSQTNTAPEKENVTPLEKMPTEQPPRTPLTISIEGVEYINIMSLAQERALVDWLNQHIKMHLALSLEDICRLVRRFCAHSKITIPTEWITDPYTCTQWVKRFLSRFVIGKPHRQRSNSTDNEAENTDSDIVEVVEDASPRPMPEEVYVCDDGTIQSPQTILRDLKLDHPYAMQPGTKLCVVNYSKGMCSFAEVVRIFPVSRQPDS